jgi:glycosyltransferase involved in cell wall biosynthesis
MRVTIDCQGLQSESSRNRGIGNYCYDFLETLLAITNKNEITLLVNGLLPFDRIEKLITKYRGSENISIRRWQPLKGSSWLDGNLERREISEQIYAEVITSTKPDKYLLLSAFEGLNEDICWKSPEGICSEVIYYDAIPRIQSERYLSSPTVRKWYSTIEQKLSFFHKIYSISDSSARDAVHFLGVSKEKIDVIHFGVVERKFDYENDAALKKAKFVLAVLGEDERKNKKNLLKAWAIISQTEVDLGLKVVYKQSPPEELINEELLRELMLSHKVEFLNNVSNEDLHNLYCECSFTIFPSFYEGLGLPVLEAYMARKACLVADASSLPELVEEKQLRFNPNSPDDIARVVVNFATDESLQESAIKNGIGILEKFSTANKISQIKGIMNRHCECKDQASRETDIEPPQGIYFHTILKPTKSGIANFAENLLHPFHSLTNLVLVTEDPTSDEYECPICHQPIRVVAASLIPTTHDPRYADIHNLGNSSHHVWQINLVSLFPGLILMHDGYLSGLTWEGSGGNTNIRNFFLTAIHDSSIFSFLEGVALLEPHLIIKNEKLNSSFVESATSIVVHNHAAADQIRDDFVIKDRDGLGIIPLAVSVKKFNYSKTHREKVIGVFGIIAETKMYEEIIQAWVRSRAALHEGYTLRFVGEDLSNHFKRLMDEYSRSFRIEHTGYVDEDHYRKQIDSVEFAIQLRRDFRGETSGAIVDLMSSGVPVISNSQPSLAEYPRDAVIAISPEFSISELSLKLDWAIENHDLALNSARLAHNYIEKHSDPLLCAKQIIEKALTSKSKSEFFPINQFKYQVSRTILDNSDTKTLRDIAESCFESFPLIFNRKRILVIVSEHASSHPIVFVSKVYKLREKLSDPVAPQIIFCKEVGFDGSLETVNSLLFDKRIQNLIGNVEFRIRKKDSDLIVISSESEKPSEYFEVVSLIKSELKDFIRND